MTLVTADNMYLILLHCFSRMARARSPAAVSFSSERVLHADGFAMHTTCCCCCQIPHFFRACNDWDKAEEILSMMKSRAIKPNEVTYTELIGICGRSGDVHQALVRLTKNDCCNSIQGATMQSSPTPRLQNGNPIFMYVFLAVWATARFVPGGRHPGNTACCRRINHVHTTQA